MVRDAAAIQAIGSLGLSMWSGRRRFPLDVDLIYRVKVDIQYICVDARGRIGSIVIWCTAAACEARFWPIVIYDDMEEGTTTVAGSHRWCRYTNDHVSHHKSSLASVTVEDFGAAAQA